MLLSLPVVILENVCEYLELRELLCSLSVVCKRTRDILRDSLTLYTHITFCTQRLGHLQCFSRWLKARAGPVVCLELCVIESCVDPLKSSEVIEHCQQAVLAVRNTLQELSLDIYYEASTCPFDLSSVLPCLPKLCKAWVAAPALVLGAGIGQLTQLQKLALHIRPCYGTTPYKLTFETSPTNSRLPPGLLKLSLRSRDSELPGVLQGLSCLQGLALHDMCLQDATWGSLHGLNSLLELHLSNCNLHMVPEELGCLTQLRALLLPANEFGSSRDPGYASFDVLSSLQRLAVLSLNTCRGVDQLPPAVVSMTSLKCLLLHNMQLDAPLPPGPYLSSLRELSLDWEVLFSRHAMLAQHAQQLTSMWLCDVSYELPTPDWHLRWRDFSEEVVASVSSLPFLGRVTQVKCEGHEAGGSGMIAASTLCMLLLARRCPHLQIDAWAGKSDALPWSTDCLGDCPGAAVT